MYLADDHNTYKSNNGGYYGRQKSRIPQQVREVLGENIRRERVIRNMTQAELG